MEPTSRKPPMLVMIPRAIWRRLLFIGPALRGRARRQGRAPPHAPSPLSRSPQWPPRRRCGRCVLGRRRAGRHRAPALRWPPTSRRFSSPAPPSAAWCRRRRGAGRARWRSASAVAARHADLVLHVAHAAARLGQILGAPLHLAVGDAAGHADDAFADVDFEVGGVDAVVALEALADVFQDALVGAAVVLRTAPAGRRGHPLPPPPRPPARGPSGSGARSP